MIYTTRERVEAQVLSLLIHPAGGIKLGENGATLACILNECPRARSKTRGPAANGRVSYGKYLMD